MLASQNLEARFCLIDVVTAINCCESNALLKAGALFCEGLGRETLGWWWWGAEAFLFKVFAILMEAVCLPVFSAGNVESPGFA